MKRNDEKTGNTIVLILLLLSVAWFWLVKNFARLNFREQLHLLIQVWLFLTKKTVYIIKNTRTILFELQEGMKMKTAKNVSWKKNFQKYYISILIGQNFCKLTWFALNNFTRGARSFQFHSYLIFGEILAFIFEKNLKSLSLFLF